MTAFGLQEESSAVGCMIDFGVEGAAGLEGSSWGCRAGHGQTSLPGQTSDPQLFSMWQK